MTPNLSRPLVLATGVFDLLHAEHVRMLFLASTKGSSLMVGLNTDASVRRLKGPGRPIINQDDRQIMLAALGFVDRVELFDEDTPLEMILRERPDVLVKGHDYQDKGLPEAAALQEWGGRVWIAPTSNRISTSQIIQKIQYMRTPQPRAEKSEPKIDLARYAGTYGGTTP